MTLLLAQQTVCAPDQGPWCELVYRATNVSWLARASDTVINASWRIALILVIAVVVRFVLHRMINRLSRTASEGTSPAMLRPLRERTPSRWLGESSPPSRRRAQRSAAIGSVLRSIVSVVIYSITFMLVLDQFGVSLGPLIASAGIVGLAIGFGAQNLVKDFLSGMFMLLEDQYGVGDVVDLGEATGTVESVGLRITTIRDIDGTVWYVRNGEVLRVGNMSQDHSVAVVDVPISHETNVTEASRIMTEAARICTTDGGPLAADTLDEPQLLGVQAVTPHNVTLRMTVKTQPGKQWAVQRLLHGAIKDAFADAGIRPPLHPNYPSYPSSTT